MSTSPDEPKGGNVLRQPNSADIARPKLALVKAFLWGGVAISGIVALAMYWEIVWDLLAEFVPLVFEFAEEGLDTLFEAIGLSPGVAQMATAYTGVVMLLVMFYVVLRKSITLTKRTKESVAVYKEVYGSLGKQWWATKRQALLVWWNGLDWMQKTAAVTAAVLIGIPLALLLSVALGTAVAMLL